MFLSDFRLKLRIVGANKDHEVKLFGKAKAYMAFRT